MSQNLPPQAPQQSTQAAPQQPKPQVQQPVSPQQRAPQAPVQPTNGVQVRRTQQAPQAPVQSTPPTPPAPDPVDYIPMDPHAKEAPSVPEGQVEVDTIITEYANSINNGTSEMEPYNLEKTALNVPLHKTEDIEKAKRRDIESAPDKIQDKLLNADSDFNVMERAQSYYSPNVDAYLESMKRIPGDIKEVLKRSKNGVGDANSIISSKFKGQERVNLTDDNSFMTTAILTGGMRRVTLWNSGITITVRKLPMTLINAFYNEINHEDYQFGKEFGAFYYHFADIMVKQFIIEKLLPVAICSSNYAQWRNASSLLGAISDNDFDTVIWAIACMMHPSGVGVNFVCGNDGCGYVAREKSDLTKLRLLNTTLINDDMIDYYKNHRSVGDEDIQTYKKLLHLNKALDFEYGLDDDWRHVRLNMRQISVADHLTVGRDFMSQMQKSVHLDQFSEVSEFNVYNLYRSYLPWVESVETTFHTLDGGKQTVVVTNTGTEASTNSIYMSLEELSQANIGFENEIQRYILDSRISHIAYYMPKCPHCGAEPATGYHGYIPYDPMANFFTLALIKLLRAVAARK